MIISSNSTTPTPRRELIYPIEDILFKVQNASLYSVLSTHSPCDCATARGRPKILRPCQNYDDANEDSQQSFH